MVARGYGGLSDQPTKDTDMIRASSILLYLGLGLATQVIGYSDATFTSLFSPDANLSVWAHILAWPLFLLLLGGYYFLCFVGICLVFCIVVRAWVAIAEWSGDRRLQRMKRPGR